MGCRDEKALLDAFCNCEVMVTLGTVRELDRLKGVEGRRGFEARNGLRILRNNSDKIKIVFDTG
jgi:predicted ribonuclease YlaK